MRRPRSDVWWWVARLRRPLPEACSRSGPRPLHAIDQPTQRNSPPSKGLAGPLFLKRAVDTLSAGAVDALVAAVHSVVCFGLCGVVQHLSKELQHPTFTPVSQAVARRVAYHTFKHVSFGGGGGSCVECIVNKGAMRWAAAVVCLGLGGAWSSCAHAHASHHTSTTTQQVLDLDISFHLDRKTGRLSRILERGGSVAGCWGGGAD